MRSATRRRADPDLSTQIAERIAGAGLPVKVREGHGLDHGVWVPMRRM